MASVAISANNALLSDITPAYVPINVIHNQEGKWTDNGRQDATGANLFNDADYPAGWAADHEAHKITKPGGAGKTTWYLNFPIAAEYLNKKNIESWTILGHNFGDLALTSLSLYIADDVAFTTNVVFYDLTSSIAGNARISGMANISGDLVSVIGGAYVRLEMISLTPFIPQIGEFYLGPLTVLPYPPLQPYDNLQEDSQFAQLDSSGGVKTRYPLNTRKRIFDKKYRFGTEVEYSRLRGVWRDAGAGQNNILFMPNPLDITTVETYLVSIPDKIKAPNFAGLATRDCRFRCEEQPPHRGNE